MRAGRRVYTGKNYRRALNIEDLRRIAARRTPNFAMEYMEGGSENEASLQHNLQSIADLRLAPRTLVNTCARHQRTELFGKEISTPLILAPTGLNGIYHHRGDVALANAAAAADIPFTLSTVSNVKLEELATDPARRLWMQLYVMKDRKAAHDIVDRAARAGYEALVFTSDANVFGRREWDQRNYSSPGKLTLRSMFDVLMHPRWIMDVMIPHGMPRFENLLDFLPAHAHSARGGVAIVPKLFTPDLSWDDVAWLRKAWPRKLLIKGILTVPDARRAADMGCDGIIVSNHGGRQLDSCLAPIDILPDIVRAVGKQMTVIVDSGFRRGTDIVKAIALGAKAVMIGRATLYGLAAGGEPGARHAINLLKDEIDRVLGQMGCCSIADLDASMVVRRPG